MDYVIDCVIIICLFFVFVYIPRLILVGEYLKSFVIRSRYKDTMNW